MNSELYGKLKGIMVEVGGADPDSIILAFTAGSNLHGAKIEGKGDLDTSGVFIGRPEEELRLDAENPKRQGHKNELTLNEDGTPKDDIRMYSLRRWAGLALKGNPDALSFLFVPEEVKDLSLEPKKNWECPYDAQQCEYPNCIGEHEGYRDSTCVKRHKSSHTRTVWDTEILPNRNLFLSTRLVKSFVGLSKDQFERMLINAPREPQYGLGVGEGLRQVDEDVARIGYKPKMAMHMVRGLYECLELLKSGQITYPRPEKGILLDIRTGKLGLQGVLDMYGTLRAEVDAAEKVTHLPPECDREKVSRLVSDAMLKHWKQKKWA
jgi:hypothetical protein